MRNGKMENTCTYFLLIFKPVNVNFISINGRLTKYNIIYTLQI